MRRAFWRSYAQENCRMNAREVLLVASTKVGQVDQPILWTCSRFNMSNLPQDVTSLHRLPRDRVHRQGICLVDCYKCLKDFCQCANLSKVDVDLKNRLLGVVSLFSVSKLPVPASLQTRIFLERVMGQ